MPLKVFVSHSAKGDAQAEGLLPLLYQRLEAEKFAPRLDREDLKFGQPWRQEINTWLTYCDAAVLLLSPNALNSTFVAYEVSVLCHRKSRNPKFTILPILLGDVNFSNSSGNLLSPAQVLEIQPHFFTHATLDQTLQKIVDVLKIAEAATPKEDERTREILVLLKNVNPDRFRQALKTLQIDLGAWDPVADEYQSAATRLMSVGIDVATQALQIMKDAKNAADIEALYHLVACSWVDSRSADTFHEVAHGSVTYRNIALTATKPEVAQLFGIRAFGQLPNDDADNWWVANVNAVFGEMAVDELKRKIRYELSQVMGVEEDEVDAFLDAVVNLGTGMPEKPVVVSMAAAAFPETLMSTLRSAFGGVTYFFLTGKSVGNEAVFQKAGIQKIEPELHSQDEEKIVYQYNKCLTWLSPKSKKKVSTP